VRENLADRHILLIGVTGFYRQSLAGRFTRNVPNIGKITLLIRRNRTTSRKRRFEKIVEESPTFDTLTTGMAEARRLSGRKSGSV